MAAGSTYTKIATGTLTASTSDLIFSSIPNTYTDLVLVIVKSSTITASPLIYINEDFGSNYSETFLRGDGSAANSGRISTAGNINTASNPGTAMNSTIVQFQNYSNTTTYKTVLWRGNATDGQVAAGVGLWRNTVAINSIRVGFSTANTTGTFNLYGIAAA
jgi:hypothetical protein